MACPNPAKMRLKNDGGACYNTHRNKGMLRKKKEGEHMKIGLFGMIALGAPLQASKVLRIICFQSIV